MQSYILISEISFWYLINYTKFFEHSNYTKLYNNIEKKSTKTQNSSYTWVSPSTKTHQQASQKYLPLIGSSNSELFNDSFLCPPFKKMLQVHCVKSIHKQEC